MRRVIAVMIAIGLGLGVFLLWPRSAADEPGSTVGEGSITTSTQPSAPATSTVPVTTTTLNEEHVVATVEEAEEILRDLWFGWFEGIYNKDEERIREVVVLESAVQTAKESFGVEFLRAPTPGDLTFSETEILRSDEQCLAVWSALTLEGFQVGSTNGVFVIRYTDDGWERLSTWVNRNDLWEADCESKLQP